MMADRPSGRGAQRCQCKCHWDLSWLRFGTTRIAVSDVDGLFVVERKDRFLFLETKAPGDEISVGQRILLSALSRVPGFTVLVLRGANGVPETLQRIIKGRWLAPEPTDHETFQSRVSSWVDAANGLSRW